MCLHVFACVGMCLYVLACVRMCWHVLACVGMCWHVLACVRMCWHVMPGNYERWPSVSFLTFGLGMRSIRMCNFFRRIVWSWWHDVSRKFESAYRVKLRIPLVSITLTTSARSFPENYVKRQRVKSWSVKYRTGIITFMFIGRTLNTTNEDAP